jgi:serine/threonine-protein kinase
MSGDEANAVEPAPQEPAPDSAAPVEAHPRRMLDRYEIIAEIARGGMGTVLLARLAGAGGFERLMAIKLMHEHLAEDESFVTMLLDEARTAANIHHPNAVGIVDIAESALGYYLVMSYVEGFTLAELIGHPDLSARERIRLGLRLLLDACHGLHAAHTTKNARGEPLDIVHRDVSPQNVLVGLDGVGRIVDFGIALAASRMAASRPGVLKGKPSYMAPEQAKGDSCDARADVFALGIILWEILIGRRLFQAEMDLATLVQVMDAPIPVPSTLQPLVPEALDAVVMKALERDLGGRYESARALARELEAAANEADLLATTHEVADALQELFAERIAAKQEAIRHHLSTSSGDEKPLQPGQLGLVPKLYDKGPSPRSSQVLSEAAHSGVRERDSGPIDPHARTSASSPGRTVQLRPSADRPEGESESEPAVGEASADEPTGGAADAAVPVAEAPTEGRRVTGWLIAVGLVALLGIGAAFAWGGGEAAETDEGGEAAEASSGEPSVGPAGAEAGPSAGPDGETSDEAGAEASGEASSAASAEAAAEANAEAAAEASGEASSAAAAETSREPASGSSAAAASEAGGEGDSAASGEPASGSSAAAASEAGGETSPPSGAEASAARRAAAARGRARDRRGARTGRRRGERRAPAPAAPARPAAPEAPSGPALETNPYLTR